MRFSYVLFCPSETPDPEDSQYHHIRLINIFLTNGKFYTCKYLPLIMLLLIGWLPVNNCLLYWSLGEKTFTTRTQMKHCHFSVTHCGRSFKGWLNKRLNTPLINICVRWEVMSTLSPASGFCVSIYIVCCLEVWEYIVFFLKQFMFRLSVFLLTLTV